MILLCKNIIVAKSKEVKTRCNLAESFKKGCDSKKGCFASDDDDDDDDNECYLITFGWFQTLMCQSSSVLYMLYTNYVSVCNYFTLEYVCVEGEE
jgi:hypothetical protein